MRRFLNKPVKTFLQTSSSQTALSQFVSLRLQFFFAFNSNLKWKVQKENHKIFNRVLLRSVFMTLAVLPSSLHWSSAPPCSCRTSSCTIVWTSWHKEAIGEERALSHVFVCKHGWVSWLGFTCVFFISFFHRFCFYTNVALRSGSLSSRALVFFPSTPKNVRVLWGSQQKMPTGLWCGRQNMTTLLTLYSFRHHLGLTAWAFRRRLRSDGGGRAAESPGVVKVLVNRGEREWKAQTSGEEGLNVDCVI